MHFSQHIILFVIVNGVLECYFTLGWKGLLVSYKDNEVL
jgi:hypothetical protein